MGPSHKSVRGQNLGNTYITYGLIQALFGVPVRVPNLSNAWEDPLTGRLADEINEKYSHFIFVLQDFIRDDLIHLPFDRITNFLTRIRLPIVPVSLGANSFTGFDVALARRLSGPQKRFLATLADQSKRIGIRGEYTAEILSALGIANFDVIGCPSYYACGPLRRIERKAWHPHGVITTGTFFNRYLPQSPHLLQDELYFINRLYLGVDGAGAESNVTGTPFNLSEPTTSLHFLQKAIEGRLEFFSDLHQWAAFWKRPHHCLTIGTRLHSAIFSINSGVPGVVTNPDARARETCEFLRIPYDSGLSARSDIARVHDTLDLDLLNAAYPDRYAGFTRFLSAHGLHVGRAPEDAPLLQFPRFERRTDPAIQPELHAACTDLLDALAGEMIALEAFGGDKALRGRRLFRRLKARYPDMTLAQFFAGLTRD